VPIYEVLAKNQTIMKTNESTKVLIALDYDPSAQKVAEAGYSMAKSMNAQVILLHILSDLMYYSSTEYSPIMGFNGFTNTGPVVVGNVDFLKEAANEYLEKSRQHLRDKTIQIMVEEGDVASTILSVGKELKVEAIVVGSHSRNWLKDILMGSVTEAVLNKTKIPLIIIPVKKHK
jgi:nucleotide-binding universal stress UspA family protein